jgi:hypothetical protein
LEFWQHENQFDFLDARSTGAEVLCRLRDMPVQCDTLFLAGDIGTPLANE